MNHSFFRHKIKFLGLILMLLLIFNSSSLSALADTTTNNQNVKSTNPEESYLQNDIVYEKYSAVKKNYEVKGYKPVNDVLINLGINDIVASSKGDKHTGTLIGGKGNALSWDETYEWLEWSVDIPKEGLYEMAMEYYPLDGSGSAIQRGLTIDGKVPFEEANNIAFSRGWKDEGEPKVNNIGDQVRPKQIEVREWRTVAFTDNEGMYAEPFQFYLTQGKHTIRLSFVDQPSAIGKIIIRSPETLPAYVQVKEQYKTKGLKNAIDSIQFQAETNAFLKTDPVIRRENNSDPMTQPYSKDGRKLNIIGSSRWKTGNQAISWKFNVPDDGLYKINMRILQNYADGLTSFRQIAIDGKVPFKELEVYAFKYESDWRTETLKDTSNNPYLFYFTKGEHTLSMTVKLGPITDIVQDITDDTLLMSELVRKITMITGDNPDPNYEYELDKNIPGLMEDLKRLSKNMDEDANMLIRISSKKPSIANNFAQIRDQLNSMIKNPDTIANRIQDLENAETNLGSWIISIRSQPLAIDYFDISEPGKKVVNVKSNFIQKTKATFLNFIRSFTTDYDSVGSVYNKSNKNSKVINVWVSRGKEWDEIMKEMADEDFTLKTGIQVNMNVLPAGQLNSGSVNTLLLAISSGKAPDVALGLTSNSPAEFAFRDAVVDLSKFSDYKSVADRFYPSVMVPFQYKDGVFALPETMDFHVLLYRTDIMKELNLKVPKTWNDLYDNVLPKLYENGMDFYYPQTSGLTPFLFQNGGSFYNKNGTKSGLETAEALKAFKQWTELNTNYGVPIEANFFSRMRSGQMPIGIANYATYMQLATAAPELYGRWNIAPMIGTKKTDGSVDRSVGQITGQGAVILSQSKHKEEAWEFLKWWTDTEVQTGYGRELEALLGVESRWNTANKDAFKGLPWNKKHLPMIMDSLACAKEQPVVLGGYFTARHITNAWNRVVLNNVDTRDSLEQGVKDINKELRSKQEEYGYIINDDK